METLDVREDPKANRATYKTYLRRLGRWFIYPRISPEVSADVAMRYLLVKTFSVVLLLTTLVWWLQFGTTPQTRYLPTMPILCASIPVILHRTKSTTIAGSLLLACLMFVSAATIQGEGGFVVLGAACSHVFPLLAVMIIGRTAGVVVAFLCILENLYFYWNRSLSLQAVPSAASERQALLVLVGYSVNIFFICALSILHDFSKTLCTDELVDICEQALDASRAKSRFVSQVSHELRTPLSAIFGWTELLLTDSKVGEESRASMKMVHTASRNLLAILNDILDVSKLGADKMVLSKSEFDLHELAVDTCHIMSGLSSKKGLELLLDYPRGMPCLFHGDPGRIRQILSNLVSNAVKFTENGYIEVSFKVQTEDVDTTRILCLVKDTGIGIPHEVQNKLFKEFSQVKGSNFGYNTRVQSGTGLGLFLVKRLTELMQGEVLMQSEPGQGSVFGFSIPLEKQKNGEVESSHINPLPTTTHFLPAFLSNPSPLYDADNGTSLRLHDRNFFIFSRSKYFESFLYKLVQDSWGVSSCHLMLEEHSEDTNERYITVPSMKSMSFCSNDSILLFDLSPGQKHRSLQAKDETTPAEAAGVDVEEWLDIICRSLVRNQPEKPQVEMVDQGDTQEQTDKPTLIFFYAFGQASKVHIPIRIKQYYDVSICRKPVSERELIDLICNLKQDDQQWMAPSYSVHSKHLPERRLSASKLKLPTSVLGGEITSPPKEFTSEEIATSPESLNLIKNLVPSDALPASPVGEKRVSISDTVEYISQKPRSPSLNGRKRSPGKPAIANKTVDLKPTSAKTNIALPKVLVVDDNSINRKLAQFQLKKLGVEHIDIAADGMIACEMHKENKYNLIFMDLQMPRMDGYEATRVIRHMENEWLTAALAPESGMQIEPGFTGSGKEKKLNSNEREDSGVNLAEVIFPRRAFIIALTADQSLDTNEGRQTALDYGMDDVAVKPVTLSALSVMLEKWFPNTPVPQTS